MTKNAQISKIISDHDIFPTWAPWFKEPPGGDMNMYRQYIFDNITFAKVMRVLKLHPEECSTGRYSHRMICPFKFHKNGRERTGSFRFSDKKKTFTCFGCNESGDILKFLSLYCGGCEQFYLKKLASFAGLSNKIEEWAINSVIEVDNELIAIEASQRILFNTGLLLRNYICNIKKHKLYNEECEWADRMLIKIDKYFDSIEVDNIKDAEKIFNNVNASIDKRKNKLGL